MNNHYTFIIAPLPPLKDIDKTIYLSNKLDNFYLKAKLLDVASAQTKLLSLAALLLQPPIA